MKLVHVRKLIDRLSRRSDVEVETNGDWLIRIPKGRDFVCEVTVPIDWCFEWHACVKQLGKKEDVWYDWMDHYGSPEEALDAEMAECIEAFVERVAQSDLKLPLSIYEERRSLTKPPENNARDVT